MNPAVQVFQPLFFASFSDIGGTTSEAISEKLSLQGRYSTIYLPDGKLLRRQNQVTNMISIPVKRSGNFIVTILSKGHSMGYIVPFVQ